MAPLKIDTHQHVFPPAVKKGTVSTPAALIPGVVMLTVPPLAIEANKPFSQGFIGPEWTPELTLEFMARNHIGTSILSCAIPFTILCKDVGEIATLTREINEYMAAMRDQNSAQFGFFAALPSPEDKNRCIEEVRYAMGVLKADSVTLFTTYNEKYFGYPDFEAVWGEPNSRAAVVFTHPTMEGMEKTITEPFIVPRALLDWSHETTRTVAHLIMTNTVRRFSACRIIPSHGGGTLPFVASRIADIEIPTRLSGKSPAEFLEDAGKFYFDIALVGDKLSLQLLLQFAGPGHILYGSDYLFVREPATVKKWENVGTASLTLATREAGQILIPRLAEEAGGFQ